MDHAVNVQVGAAIRFQRETKLRLTQGELAARLGLSRPSVANIEKGRQQLTVVQLVRFARALGVEPAELIPAFREIGPTIPPSAQLPSSTKASIREWADKLFQDHV